MLSPNDLLAWCRLRLVADAQKELGRGYVNFGSDLVQDTLLEAHKKAERIRELAPAELLAWLREVLKRKMQHAWRDRVRAKRDASRQCRLEDVAPAVLTVNEPSPAEQAELAERIERAIQGLNRQQQLAIILKCFCGWSSVRISECLGIQPSSVSGLLYRGIRQLSKSGLLSPDDLA
jgi:RNA polymerase sigma factor (sigma-70 family)